MRRCDPVPSGTGGILMSSVPDSSGIEPNTDGQPLAVLRLSVREVPWGRGHEWLPHPAGSGRLRFDYAGHRFPPGGSDVERVKYDGRALRIRRDRAFERRWLATLGELGMVPLAGYLEGFRHFRIDGEIDPGDVINQPGPRRPPLTAPQWQAVIERLAVLGAVIEYSPEFPRDHAASVANWQGELVDSGESWFDLSLSVEVDGQRIDLLPLLRRVLNDPQFSLKARPGEADDAKIAVSVDDHRRIELPVARVRELIDPLLEWLQIDVRGSVRIHRTAVNQLDGLVNASVNWSGGSRLRERLGALRAIPPDTHEPEGFRAKLRDYQRDGLGWLGFLAETRLGGILADDMGLGKTVQVLAHVLAEKQRGRLEHPVLVIAPTSLVGNWRDEAARFVPDLRLLVLHGNARGSRFGDAGTHDLLITTYPLLSRDRERLLAMQFSLLVLDEAQAIKNPRSLAAQVVRDIRATRRLAMTGTPLENHLGELWSQFDAVEPGLLGSNRQFTRFFRTPIEKYGDVERRQHLQRRIGPLLLRRRKEDVLPELPPRTEMVHRLALAPGQDTLYESLRLIQHARVRDAVREHGLAQSSIIVLDALLKLRQVCCDPRLVKLDSARRVRASAKLDALMELLPRLLLEGRRVLVFSQFTTMLGLISEALDREGLQHLMLTGDTPGTARSELVARFQEGEVPVFLVSLKAGGIGLNLTAADTVIHYDPWWNPAAESQATDRAYRIGQDKPVFVYKLICAGTVEEKIQGLQMRKSDLADAVLMGGSIQKLNLDEEDLGELFAPL